VSENLHQTILEALATRADWEDKQRLFYAMRHEGLRRGNRAAWQADMHYPLVDGAIESFKPFYVNQLTADQYVAEFTALRKELAAFRDSARAAFDWLVKHRTDFFAKCLSAVDTMLMRQRGILKFYWDADEKKVVVEVVDPLYFIVPTKAVGPDEDDWFVHVKQLSIGQYRRSKVYRQADELIAKIRGGARDEEAGNANEEEKLSREGLTDTKDKDTIIIWERWERTAAGWLIREYSPYEPAVDLRPPRQCGEKWRGKPWQPFVGLVCEIKDEGWYAPRGLAERLGPFEVALCKQWNMKLDALAFVGKPTFSREDELPGNTLNVSFQPGEVLPKGVKPNPMPELPKNFDQDMSLTRAVAQDYIKLPSAGVNADPTQKSGGEKPTARQVSYQASLTSSELNMRGFVFRLGLKDCLWRMWALFVKHQAEAITYYVGQDINVLPQDALSDQFEIEPAGAVDAWNRSQRKQDAGQRFNAFNGDPMIDQEELRRDVLNAEDARLTARLLVPQGRKDMQEAEDEAVEILLLMEGWPALALPTENHELRLRILYGKLQQMDAQGRLVDALVLQRFQEHIQQHEELLAQQNPTLARQFAQARMALAEPDNVVGMGAGPQTADLGPQTQPALAGGAM